MHGKLYLVSTPIGNLKDITLRAIETLKEVDIIACEDTRRTKKLLTHYCVHNSLISYHEHNELAQSKKLIRKLIDGKNIALVTDAGTPGISDPGYRLIRASIENAIDIISIPGPTACISALTLSGLPTSSFFFLGFLPKTSEKKKGYLENIKDYPHTLVIYEAPKRVINTLKTIYEILGDRNISVSRELTKLYEETTRNKISHVIDQFEKKQNIQGEFVLVLDGYKTHEIDNNIIENELIKQKNKGLSLKDAVNDAKNTLAISKSRIYKLALNIWKNNLD